VKHLLPILDDLERALEAAEQHEEAKLEEGVALVHRSLADLLRRQGLEEIETSGRFDPHIHEALLAQPSEAEEGSVIQVTQKGYRLGDLVLRPARVIVSGRRRGGEWLARRTRRSASRRRRPPTRSRRRTASSRARTTPDRNPGDKAAEERFKEYRTRTTRSPTRRSASSTTPSARRTAAVGRRRAGNVNIDFGDLGDFLGGCSAAGARQQQRPRGMRGADIEAEVRLSFEDSLRGIETRIPVEVETACSECGGTGAKPGTLAQDLPRVQRARRPG
jgi:hypothetical protein